MAEINQEMTNEVSYIENWTGERSAAVPYENEPPGTKHISWFLVSPSQR